MSKSTFVYIASDVKLKVGTPVRIRDDHSQRHDTRGMEIAALPFKVIVSIQDDDAQSIGVGPAVITGREPEHNRDYWYFMRQDLALAPMTKADLEAAIAAETKRLKEQFIASRDADKIAKKAEEDRLAKIKKEEAEAAKALKNLSPAGQRVVKLLNDKPRLLSGYRESVIAVAEAYTGDKLSVLIKKT